MDTPKEYLNLFKPLAHQNDKSLDTHRGADFKASENHLKFKFQSSIILKYIFIEGKPSQLAFHG